MSTIRSTWVCATRRHSQGGYVSWAHFPSWPGVESPLDVAMEKLDGLEILCVLEPREMPIFMKQLVPDSAANDGLRLWYRYLNCGFRLTATAGTDKMTTFVTVGANRVYARLSGDFTYQGWIDALRAGRTFVTNSPILSFTVNGQEAGSLLRFDSRRDKVVKIHATAESQLPYDRLEIVSNGQVIAQTSPSGIRHRAEIHVEHPVNRVAGSQRARWRTWSVSARGSAFSTVHVDKGTLLSDYFGTRRPETVFAHSSPVYALRDGEPIRSWDDAQYYIHYIDNCIQWLKRDARFSKLGDKEASIEAFLKGRVIYERHAQEARGRNCGKVPAAAGAVLRSWEQVDLVQAGRPVYDRWRPQSRNWNGGNRPMKHALFTAILALACLSALPVPSETRFERRAQRNREIAKQVVWPNHEPLLFYLRRGRRAEDWPRTYERQHDPENIRRMAEAGVRSGRLHFYKGFGLNLEMPEIEKSREMAELMHKLGMKVSVYVAGTMFIESFYRELPEAEQWEQRDQDNIRSVLRHPDLPALRLPERARLSCLHEEGARHRHRPAQDGRDLFR